MNDVTQILSALEQGDPQAADQLIPLVYDELRKLAAQRLAHEAPGQTLQPTALVHEAYLRLVSAEKGQHWDNRGHFFSAAAEAMRRIMVENARRKKAEIHGGNRHRVEIENIGLLSEARPEEIVALDDSLNRLAEEDPAAAELVKLRLFAGLSVAEAANSMGISERTAYRHLTYARAWIQARWQ